MQYVIAYSGGVDSHVLLHCCKQLKLPVRAVHVHHGLQDVADDWVQHCQSICKQYAIPLDIFYVDAKPQQGFSPEEVARNLRYEAIYKNLKTGECLVTAQHKNDQAETLLLQLFRTASAAGLAAMPAVRKINYGSLENAKHIRPLLTFSREEIINYAENNTLQWIEDPSNQNTDINRNFIRKEILPILQNRWPEVNTQLTTVARLQADNLRVLEDMATIDLANLMVETESVLNNTAYTTVSTLSINALRELSPARISNALRLWIINLAAKQPSRNLLQEIDKTLINSSQDAVAVVKFSGFEFRKFQGTLYLLKAAFDSGVQNNYHWSPQQALKLTHLKQQLSTRTAIDEGLSNRLLDETLTVSFRKGGERFHPSGRQHSQSLKKLLQEANIPPWERDFIPLVYSGENLVAVGDLWLAKSYLSDNEEGGWHIQLGRID